jgi:hypothetical protein
MTQSTETRPLEALAVERETASDSGLGASSPRRRGRPLMMTRETVLDRIRRLAARHDGLFRMHRSHPGLYARARRLFGSWSAAVAAAGLDYAAAVARARERSLRTRLRRARQRQRN